MYVQCRLENDWVSRTAACQSDRSRPTMITSWLLLAGLLAAAAGDYGHGGPKCGTTYHTVYTTVFDTFFEKSCAKVSDRQCKTVFDTSYEGQVSLASTLYSR